MTFKSLSSISHTNACSVIVPNMGVERIFTRGRTTEGFFQNFSRGAKNGKIFFPLKTKKTTFFAVHFKIKGARPSSPLRRPWFQTEEALFTAFRIIFYVNYN